MTCDYRGTPTHLSQNPLLLLLHSSEREAGLIFLFSKIIELERQKSVVIPVTHSYYFKLNVRVNIRLVFVTLTYLAMRIHIARIKYYLISI